MPRQAPREIIRDSDVMPRWLAFTSENVDDGLVGSVHAHAVRRDSAHKKRPTFRRIAVSEMQIPPDGNVALFEEIALARTKLLSAACGVKEVRLRLRVGRVR